MKIYKFTLIFSLAYSSIYGQKILPNFFEYDRSLLNESVYAQNPTIRIGGISNTEVNEAQNLEITTYSTLPDMDRISLHWLVFPNPFKEFLILKIEGDLPENYKATIYDMNGNGLINEQIASNETTFLTNNLVSGVYLVKVIQLQGNTAQKVLKTFKVIKK